MATAEKTWVTARVAATPRPRATETGEPAT